MSSIFTEPSDTARAESPEAVQTYLIDLESENAALQDQLTEAKAEHTALVEAARAVEKRHQRKVTQGDLSYIEYESEALEALANLIDAKGAEKLKRVDAVGVGDSNGFFEIGGGDGVVR